MAAEGTYGCPAYQRAAGCLADRGDLRVWSVIVTIFGDLAGQEGDSLSGALLTRLTELLGIRPEAMRVALHRLRKDGWIVSVKSGRSSNYHLTAKGRLESRVAGKRIYAQNQLAPVNWHLLIAQPGSQADRMTGEANLRAQGYVIVAQGAYLKAGAPGPASGFLCDFLAISGQIALIPDWLRLSLATDTVQASMADLEICLRAMQTALAVQPALPDPERAALRVLIVHNWRRLVLRLPDLPDGFFPGDWRGAACRTLVGDLLATLTRPSLSCLEDGH